MRGRVLFVLIAIEIVYLIGGGFIFWALENPPVSVNQTSIATATVNVTRLIQVIERNVGNGSCVNKSELTTMLLSAIVITTENVTTQPSNWDIGGSIFFAMTVVSTIGYGNLYPTTDGSRVFFCFYAIIGIPITLVMMVGIGEKLNGLATRFEERMSRKRPRIGKIAKSIVILLAGVLAFLLIPALIFSYLQNWSYGTAVYYGVVTLTTIGFGDYVAGFPCPQGQSVCGFYRVTIGIWIFLGLAWLSGLISSLQQSFDAAVRRVNTDPIIDRYRAKQQQQQHTLDNETTVSDPRTDGHFVKLSVNGDDDYDDRATVSGQSAIAGDVGVDALTSNEDGVPSAVERTTL